MFCFVLSAFNSTSSTCGERYVCMYPSIRTLYMYTYIERATEQESGKGHLFLVFHFSCVHKKGVYHTQKNHTRKKKDTPRGHPTRGQRERQGVGAQSHPCCAGSRLPLPALAPVFFCFCFCFCFWFWFWFFFQVFFVGSGAWG